MIVRRLEFTNNGVTMKKIFGALVGIVLMAQGLTADEPYDSINLLDPTPYYVPNSWMISNALQNNQGTVFIDVNSNDGGAARYAASYIPGIEVVYNVSTWNATGSYQQFLSNVRHESTDGLIIPVRMGSAEGSLALNVYADFIYVNSDNPAELTDAILKWFPHLNANGIIAGDNWNSPQVELAVVLASSALGLSINAAGTYWWLSQ